MKQKRLQVGLDISQSQLDLCAMTQTGEVLIAGQRVANNRAGYDALHGVLCALLAEEGLNGLDIAAESTGYYWLPLFVHLQGDRRWPGEGPRLYLLNPRQVYWFKKGYSPADKTDAKDSYFVAEKLRTQRGLAHPWSVDEQWQQLRFYSRLRFHLGQALTREKNYFWSHMFLMSTTYRTHKPFGDGLGATGRALVRHYPDWQQLERMPAAQLQQQLDQWSHRRLPDVAATTQQLRQVARDSFPLPATLQPAVHTILTTTLDHIAFLEKQATQVERCLVQAVEQDHPAVNHLRDIKGIGIVLAAGIAAEIGDLNRFFDGLKWDKRRGRYRRKNLRDVEDAVAKLAGLWWPRHSSGAFEGQERRLSKKGNRFLRYYLVEAADKLRQYQPQYRAFYQRKYRQTKKYQHKRALVLTARKSVGLFVGLLHRNEPYRPPEVSATHNS